MAGKEIKLYICPACKSPKVRHLFALRNIFGVIPTFICNNCGYKARIFPIIVIDSKKLNQLNKKQKSKK